MDYYSLDEAAAELNRRPGASPLTASALLREGVAGRMLVCAPMDTEAYSPTVKARNAEPASAHATDAAGVTARATVEMYGLFVVPPRHLFAIESSGATQLGVVYSLDGRDVYFPNVSITRDQLRIARPQLESFSMSQDQLSATTKTTTRGRTAPALSPKQQDDVRKRLNRGETVTVLAVELGVSRRTIDKYKPPVVAAGVPARSWPGPVTRHKAK